MFKICKPYHNATIHQISQPFGVNPTSYQPNGHTGVDIYPASFAYGTFLVAPEDVIIKEVIDQTTFAVKFLENLSKGFGVLMTSKANPDVDYLYWHLLPNIPVKKGQLVSQGEAVGQMGNSGFVMSGGVLVPIEHRSIKPYNGTHLHYEVRVKNQYVNPIPLIDFSIPVKRTTNQWIMQVLLKMSNLLK